jgi:hypothetical protein
MPLFWLVIDAVKYGLEVIGNPNWPENVGDKEKAGFLKLRMKVSLWGCWFFLGLTIFGGIFFSKSTELLDLLYPNVAETWTASQSKTQPLVNGLLRVCSLSIAYLLSVCWYTQSMKENIVKLAAEILKYYNETNSEASEHGCVEIRGHFPLERTPNADQRGRVEDVAVPGRQEIGPLRLNNRITNQVSPGLPMARPEDEDGPKEKDPNRWRIPRYLNAISTGFYGRATQKDYLESKEMQQLRKKPAN